MKVKAIVAMDGNRVIGFNNSLPWHISEDLKRFSRLTSGHAVLMGRKTYDSLPSKYKPLPGRLNIVISKSLKPGKQALASDNSITGTELIIVSDPKLAISHCKMGDINIPSDTVWVIGGEQIYQQLLTELDEIFVTKVDGAHQGDAFFPQFEEEFEMIEREEKDGYAFESFRRVKR